MAWDARSFRRGFLADALAGCCSLRRWRKPHGYVRADGEPGLHRTLEAVASARGVEPGRAESPFPIASSRDSDPEPDSRPATHERLHANDFRRRGCGSGATRGLTAVRVRVASGGRRAPPNARDLERIGEGNADCWSRAAGRVHVLYPSPSGGFAGFCVWMDSQEEMNACARGSEFSSSSPRGRGLQFEDRRDPIERGRVRRAATSVCLAPFFTPGPPRIGQPRLAEIAIVLTEPAERRRLIACGHHEAHPRGGGCRLRPLGGLDACAARVVGLPRSSEVTVC